MGETERLREDLGALQELERETGDENSLQSQELLLPLQKKFQELQERFSREELATFLSGAYDHLSATLTVSSGAGGRDASDWASILLRMYQRWAEQRRFRAVLLHEHRGEEGGIKNATIEITGANVYGFLRNESGVHRLVRISPFDASKRRHTSFAAVEVLPVLSQEAIANIEIKPDDIEIEMFRSSGPGGQNVNKRETAVRIHHKPTGMSVAVQSERTQGANRERALAMLAAKLAKREEEKRNAELAKIRGHKMATEWGSQIRSYVLHPYQMVKDHRTGAEMGDIERVLDGAIDPFLEAELRQLHTFQ